MAARGFESTMHLQLTVVPSHLQEDLLEIWGLSEEKIGERNDLKSRKG